ncbi:hypothetical protein BJ170DRAFT_598248 [Xylariales sp. AK1849]|nr:hypothetical protein BJ170DRAFT_598248 [Xylariales sp. AK1849]
MCLESFNTFNKAIKTASFIPSLLSTSSPSFFILPPRVISPQRAAPAASSLRFEEDIVTRSPAGSPHTTRIQAGTNELPPPLPVYAFLIKALKGVPACSSARHLDQQAVNTHSHLHRDERTSVSCHCLGDVTLAMEGRPLPASPAVPPASAGYHESLRRAIRQLRLGDDGGEPAGGAATPVPLDQVPVSLPSGPPLPKVLDSGRLGMRAYPENLYY